MFLFILLLNIGIFNQNNLNHLTLTEIRAKEFPAYKSIEKLNNSDLLTFFKENNTEDTEDKILSITKDRNFKINELNIKLSLLKRIELVKNLNKESIQLIKFSPYYFIALSYLEDNIFTNKDRKYLFKLLNCAIKQKKSLVIQRIFSLNNTIKIGFFNAIILIKTISEDEKIFFTSSLLDIELNIKEKKNFKKQCLKKLYNFKNPILLNNILFLLPQFFVFSTNDLITIYQKIDKKNKFSFLNSLILNNVSLPMDLVNIIDLNNNKLFLALLKYSDKNNQKIKRIEKKLSKYTQSSCKGRSPCLPHEQKCSNCLPHEQIPYLNLYLNKNLFNVLKNNKNNFIKFLRNLVENNKKNMFIERFSLKNWNNLKINLYIRILLTKYLLNNNKLNNQKVLKFIITLFTNKKLEYKSDEYYISIILPILAQNYNKNDYSYYKKLLKMLNKTSIESTLEAIKISSDKKFIKDLKPLLKEIEIKDLVEDTIWKLEN